MKDTLNVAATAAKHTAENSENVHPAVLCTLIIVGGIIVCVFILSSLTSFFDRN